MTTEHVSVPRELLEQMRDDLRFDENAEWYSDRLAEILSRATPSAPRVVSDEDVERACKAYDRAERMRYDDTTKRGMRAALISFASQPHAARAEVMPFGEPVAWLHDVVQGDGEPDQALSFSKDSFPLDTELGFRSTGSEPLFRGGKAIKEMVDRFLGWRLPKDFSPDCGVKFDPDSLKAWPELWPIGTNLLNADQAEQMFRYVLAAAPKAGETK